MVNIPRLKFDEIGIWSEIKLEIISKYASAYSKVLDTRPKLYHVYIDAFSGAGTHISKTTGEFVDGSPIRALQIIPPFREYHFIDLNQDKIKALREKIGDRIDVHTYAEDCNKVLLTEIFPRVLYEDYRRGLCLLDPYGLHLNWEVIKKAGAMRSVEIFLNFPVADINRNVLRRNPEGVDPEDIKRMNAYWGDNTWRNIAYNTTKDLFGFPEKEDNESIAATFQRRLREEAGFKYVPTPLAMKNSKNAIVYYLFFASQNEVGGKIVNEVFGNYR